MFLVAVGIAVVIASTGSSKTEDKLPVPTVGRDLVKPTATPEIKHTPLKLEVHNEGLTPEQSYYQQMSLVLPSFPQFYGLLDKKAVNFTEEEAVVFAALIGSESRWNQYDSGQLVVSSSGCIGLGQICNMGICGGVTEEERQDPRLNLYHAACYFDALIDEEEGDWERAIARYKGALVNGVITHPEQVNSVFDFLKIKGVQR